MSEQRVRELPGPGDRPGSHASVARMMRRVAVVLGALVAVVGGSHLVGWLGGWMAERGLVAITMKTNSALCLLLTGVALVLLAAPAPGRGRRRAARACAAVVGLLGALTLAQHLLGVDLGIDQLLAREHAGALAVVQANRMGPPASASFALLGAALILLSGRRSRTYAVAQVLALAASLIGLLGVLGYLYGVESLYALARLTGIAWPTAASLLALGIGAFLLRPEAGPAALVAAGDPGGAVIRRLAGPAVLLVVALGWLDIAGEAAGLFDARLGSSLRSLIMVGIFTALIFAVSRRLSRAAADERRAVEGLAIANRVLEGRVGERTAELRARSDQLARLTSELASAEHRERARLARVLHDDLQQIVVAAKLRLRVLARASATSEERAALVEVQGLLDEAYAVSQAVTTDLSPPVLIRGDLPEVLRWLVRWSLEKHALSVELALEEGIPAVADETKLLLFDAVRELLLNVVKHAGVNRASVRVWPADPGTLGLEVCDEGRGFAPSSLAQGDRLTGGLGLLSVRERLQSLGGRCELAAEPGRGTRVTLLLPAGSPARPAVHPPELAAIAEPDAKAAARTAIRVLLVDDHRVVREGIGRMLSAESDIDVVGDAADGRAAVEAAHRLRPDVILMDCSMPVMDGVEATRAIHAELPGIRIIGLSMYQEPSVAAAMVEAGASTYLTKSGSPETLVEAIRGAPTAAENASSG